MEARPEVVSEGYRLLESHLQRAGLSPEPISQVTLEALRAWLEQGVKYLLNQNMEALLQLCYRVDLPEAEVSHILSTAPPDSLAAQLADLILHREFQKVNFRQKYRQGS